MRFFIKRLRRRQTGRCGFLRLSRFGRQPDRFGPRLGLRRLQRRGGLRQLVFEGFQPFNLAPRGVALLKQRLARRLQIGDLVFQRRKVRGLLRQLAFQGGERLDLAPRGVAFLKKRFARRLQVGDLVFQRPDFGGGFHQLGLLGLKLRLLAGDLLSEVGAFALQFIALRLHGRQTGGRRFGPLVRLGLQPRDVGPGGVALPEKGVPHRIRGGRLPARGRRAFKRRDLVARRRIARIKRHRRPERGEGAVGPLQPLQEMPEMDVGFRIIAPLLQGALIGADGAFGPAGLFQRMTVLNPDIGEFGPTIERRLVGLRRVIPVTLVTRCVATGDQRFDSGFLRCFSTK